MTGGTVLPAYANALCPAAESLHGGEGERASHFREIRNNLLLRRERTHHRNCAQEKTISSHAANLSDLANNKSFVPLVALLT